MIELAGYLDKALENEIGLVLDTNNPVNLQTQLTKHAATDTRWAKLEIGRNATSVVVHHKHDDVELE